MKKFPFVQQLGLKDCGPACLKMIARWYGRRMDFDYLRQKCNINKMGVSMLGISEAAEAIGFRTVGVLADEKILCDALQSGPLVLHWNHNHFVVLYKVEKKRFFSAGRATAKDADVYCIADPAKGLIKVNKVDFLMSWKGVSAQGAALILEPGESFFQDAQEGRESKKGFGVLWPYFNLYRYYFLQIVVGMLLSSAITLAGPFLTQAVVDQGINRGDIHFIYLILLAQIALFFGSTMIEIVRSWILIYVSSRINVSMVSEYFKKLMALPVRFYEQYVAGDLMQRINDHSRIEKLLTVNSFSTLFSLFNLIVLSFILFGYSRPVFLIFASTSLLSLLWISLFLKKRRNIDFRFFEISSKNNNIVMEILESIQEIKMNNATLKKRWEWESVQSRLYKVKQSALSLNQWQSVGNSFISRLSGLLVTFTSAEAVINGRMTMGEMFAINMIIGQISMPVAQLLSFVSVYQDAKIGLERVSDVKSKENEELDSRHYMDAINTNDSLSLEGVVFHYGSESLPPELDHINLEIPTGKVTAIVGASGSGKTTLLKLLLKIYKPNKGAIYLGQNDLENYRHSDWRERCGVVMQDGQLLSGTIADNIALGHEPDMEQVIESAKLSNIHGFVEKLPMGYRTQLGREGIRVSMGQKQRILMARAVYKSPSYLFLDEATSSLDAENERIIVDNLKQFYEGRTVVVVAHRLSTVRNADKIVVMEKGKIEEEGTHDELVSLRGKYYSLIRNQLELENA